MARSTSTTPRSTRKLKEEGYDVANGEQIIRWDDRDSPLCPACKRYTKTKMIRRDFGNFADLIAWRDGEILAVQSTTHSNRGSRIWKILAEPQARKWLAAGGRIVIHGWHKRKIKRGGVAVRWECSEHWVTELDFKREEEF